MMRPSRCPSPRLTFNLARLAAAGAVALTLAAMPASAQTQLPDLSIEDLMKLDAGQVYGASERLQPVIEAPASVSFITAEEIARFGYRTLADILHSVRGLYVTTDRNFSYVGARGFSNPGDYNSRILLLINGHRVNDSFYGQAEIGAEFGLDPATFERVEIIRGPASSLYGDSAFFAVVNVITRTGATLQGASIAADVGTLGTGLARITAGNKLANGVDFAVSTTYEQREGVDNLYFPEFDAPETNNGVAENLDGEFARQFYGRLAYRGLTFTGAYGTRKREVPTASFGTRFNEQTFNEQTTDRHTLLDAEYVRPIGEARLAVRGSFDRFTYTGIYPFDPADPGDPVLVGEDNVEGTRWTAGARLTRSLFGHQTLTAGVEYIDNVAQNQSSRYIDPPAVVLDSHRSSQQGALYAQDEIRPTPWLILNGGIRYDAYEQFQRASPRAAAIILPSSTQSVKYLYGRAFRAPNAYELNSSYFGPSVADLRPETIDTHEIVWESYPTDRLRTSVSTYWYRADRLITTVPDDSTLLGATLVNQGEVRATGVELEAQARLGRGVQALASYSVQRAIDQVTDAGLPNSPRHLGKARVTLPLTPSRGFLSLDAEAMSRRLTIHGNYLPAVVVVNMSVIQPIRHNWDLVGTVRNLFDTEYADPGAPYHRQNSIPRNGATARIGLRWKFLTP